MSERLSPRERQLRLIPERQFQSDVEQLLTLFGWRHFHAPDNVPRNGHIQNVKAGFPDIVATRGTRIFFAELKTQTGMRSIAQEEWANAILKAGAEYYLWRPGDMDEIQNILASPTRP